MTRMKRLKCNLQLAIFLINSLLFCSIAHANPNKHVILFIWDGLRPDSVTAVNTPNLWQLTQEGVLFKDNHSSYPTLTMINAASFASGNLAGKTGFFGNSIWVPTARGKNAQNNVVDFQQPVFTEDYKILQDIAQTPEILLNAENLFQVAHKSRLITATVGKNGAAFIQNYHTDQFYLDESHVFPLYQAQQLQGQALSLPFYSPYAFQPGQLILAQNNGDPTLADPIQTLNGNSTGDPTTTQGSPYKHSNQYLMDIFANQVMPFEPNLAVIWLRNPDSTEHVYGPGTLAYLDALKNNDDLLKQLRDKLVELDLANSTDIIVVSDHSHSNVSGPFNEFPLRQIENGSVVLNRTAINGFSVSGAINTADLLTNAGFHAYNGEGCRFDPVLSGIKADGSSLFPTQTDPDGSICGSAGQRYTFRSHVVPNVLPNDAVIIADDGGSNYFYIPSHNPTLVKRLVTFMQTHEQYGAIFVNTRYNNIAGTLPLSLIKIQNQKSPDLVVSLTYDETAKINGLPGIEFSSNSRNRGNHGSFSPIDVHNFLAATGPDFLARKISSLPSGNIDVAPTIATILGLTLFNRDGRVLYEALKSNSIPNSRTSTLKISSPTKANNLSMFNALGQAMPYHSYSIELQMKLLQQDNKYYTYFDYAKARRE